MGREDVSRKEEGREGGKQRDGQGVSEGWHGDRSASAFGCYWKLSVTAVSVCRSGAVAAPV